MKVEYPIYADSVIQVVLWSENADSAEKNLFSLAVRYLKPQNYQNMKVESIHVTNVMGGETDWFVVPYTFSVSIAKTLIEQKASGLAGFDENGFERMINWLIEMEEVNDSMCY